MAACEFCLQDGGVSESFTHKMAAWENCLQDGGNATKKNNVEYVLRLQCRIYLVNVTWPTDSSMFDVRHWTVWRSTVMRWTFDNARRHVTAFRPVSEAARSWSCDNWSCLSLAAIVSNWTLFLQLNTLSRPTVVTVIRNYGLHHFHHLSLPFGQFNWQAESTENFPVPCTPPAPPHARMF